MLFRYSALALITAVALVWLAAGLPARTFLTGDAGVKLIAAYEAVAHPARPFEIDLPRIGQQRVPFTDPMVVVHGGHAHALQSPLFPPLSALFLALFGLRGVYVLPAIAFVAIVVLLEAIRRRTLPHTSRAALACLAVVASPLLLYALEFWEHAPAVALLAAGTAAVIAAPERGASWLAVAGGALAGAGVLLRPEGAWYAAGLLVTFARPRWAAFVAGAACVGLPFAAANLVHFGNPLGAHAAAVLAPIGESFAAARAARVLEWWRPASAVEWAGLLLVAAAWVTRSAVQEMRTRQTIALAGVAIVAVLAARRLLADGSVWQGFPLALLAFVPVAAAADRSRQLAALAIAAVAGVVLTATNDGGSQWGVRYLLIAAPPLLLLAARAATDAAGPGRWFAARVALLVVIAMAGAMTSRAAYVELRGTKRNYEGLVSATAAFVPAGGLVVTNAWWLDQVAAALHPTRVFLFVPDANAAARALAIARAEGVGEVTLAWPTDGTAPFALEPALDGTCFHIAAVEQIPLRSLRLATARCAPLK